MIKQYNKVCGLITRHVDGFYEFNYLDKLCTPLIAFPDTNKAYFSTALFPSFSSRVPSKGRVNIAEILQRYGLLEYDAFDMLSKSGGVLAIDTLEFVEVC